MQSLAVMIRGAQKRECCLPNWAISKSIMTPTTANRPSFLAHTLHAIGASNTLPYSTKDSVCQMKMLGRNTINLEKLTAIPNAQTVLELSGAPWLFTSLKKNNMIKVSLSIKCFMCFAFKSLLDY